MHCTRCVDPQPASMSLSRGMGLRLLACSERWSAQRQPTARKSAPTDASRADWCPRPTLEPAAQPTPPALPGQGHRMARKHARETYAVWQLELHGGWTRAAGERESSRRASRMMRGSGSECMLRAQYNRAPGTSTCHLIGRVCPSSVSSHTRVCNWLALLSGSVDLAQLPVVVASTFPA